MPGIPGDCWRDAELKPSKKEIKKVLHLHIRFCPEGVF
jgi:hypothetical protein